MSQSQAHSHPTDSHPELARRLGLTSAIMVVIGSVIGSGIFLTPQSIAAAVEVPGVMIFVWILTGLLTLAGVVLGALLLYAGLAVLQPYIDRAYAFVKDTVARGGQVILLGIHMEFFSFSTLLWAVIITAILVAILVVAMPPKLF